MELPLTCLVTIKTVCVVFMDRKTISVLFAELSILLFADSNFCPETEAIISSLVCQLFHSWIAILFWIVTDTLSCLCLRLPKYCWNLDNVIWQIYWQWGFILHSWYPLVLTIFQYLYLDISTVHKSYNLFVWSAKPQLLLSERFKSTHNTKVGFKLIHIHFIRSMNVKFSK